MSNNNYFKLITDGRIERLEHFDDTRPHSVTAAYIRVTRGRYVAPGDMHRVVVWKQGPSIPDHVPEVGTWYCPKCNQGAEGHRPSAGCPLAA
jgi:hypothetical protein